MRRKHRSLLILIVVTLISTACGASSGDTNKSAGPNLIEFGSPIGKFRVTAPAGWKRSDEVMRSTSATSANGDIMFQVLMVDPPQTSLDQLPNPRKFTSNGREIVIMDQWSGVGNASSTFAGHSFNAKDTLNGFVKAGDHGYLVGLQPATTVKVDDALTKTFVDMLGTLEKTG